MTEPPAARPLQGRHVAVLMGGLSAEREISLSTGRGCVEALRTLGATVSAVDAGRDLAQVLTALKPDVVLNVLHGVWGEDGSVQGVLETLAIPYTHSGVLASALCMDKNKSKFVLAASGVKVPGGGLYDRHEVARRHVMPPPYVVKPNAEGSSVGVYRVLEGANSPPFDVGGDSWTFGDLVMVEPYIAGRELCVTVIGEASGPRAHVTEACLRQAERAHVALGCRGVTRSDFRYDDVKDDLVLLEVNNQPGMTPTSLVPEQAAYAGMSYEALVLWMVEDASCPR
jgi:D-alanine-D-alanine ligase